MNEFNRHKKSDKIKWVFTGIAFLLVFVMLIGMCLQLFGKGKVKPSEWFNKTECVHIDENGDGKCDKCKKDMPADGEDDKPQVDNGTGGMDIADGSVTESGIKLNRRVISRASYEEEGISPLAESAQQLTATLTPADADNKLVDWAVAFVNPSASWASGKTVTDYVTVTPTSNGALTANVECKQAFGAQIKITVTSRVNAKATATCTVDYRRKLNYTDFVATCSTSSASNLTLNHSTSSTVSWKWLTYSGDEAIFTDWAKYTNTFTDNFGSVYTVDDPVASHNIVVSAHSTLQSKISALSNVATSADKDLCKKSYTYTGVYNDGYNGAHVLTQANIIGSISYSWEGLLRCFTSTYEEDGGDYDYMSETQYGLMKTALKACTIDFVMTVNTTLQSGAKFTKSFNVNVLDSSLVTVANSASLNKTTLIF